MAFAHGSKAAILLGSTAVTTYLNNLSFKADVPVADTTTFGSAWKSGLPGQLSGTLDMGGFYDPTLDNIRATLGAATDSVLTVGPAGLTTIGDVARLASAVATSYSETSPVGDAVAFAWSVACDGTVGMGQCLHPLGVDTGTTTGADKDDGAGASIASGWTAHLHVTAVSSGSWVVKLQDALTTDWADVTGAAFTAATGATSQRLVAATSTTALRRHVRYIATVTGGSSPTITFSLSYARN